MNLYSVEFDPRTEQELRKLPLWLRRRISQQIEYLRAAPYRSHPGVRVKSTREIHGLWHFHATKDVRVFYTTEGSVIWVVMVERSPGVNSKTVRAARDRR